MKTRIILFSLFSSFYFIFYLSCTKDKGKVMPDFPYCDTLPAAFQKDIIPIMTSHCSNPPFANCHQWATTHSSIKLYIDNGSFQNRVIDLKNMPPPNNVDSAPPLTNLEIQRLNCWISQCAPNN